MIVMGGFLKGKAAVFGIMGVVFIVLAFTMGSFTRNIFLIIGIADLVAAGLSLWMARAGDTANQQQQEPGDPGHWVR